MAITSEINIIPGGGLEAVLALKAPLASPAFTGTPTAPTAAAGTRTTQLATTAFVPTQVKTLTGDVLNTGTTAAKLTTLDVAAGIGTWVFQYFLRYQSAALTTGVKFSVNHTGTVTSFIYQTRNVNAAATVTNAPSQNENLTTAGPHQGHSARAKSTAAGLGPTLSVDAINSDMLMIIEGLMIVTVAGNIELYHASEVVANSTVMTGSSLILTKTA